MSRIASDLDYSPEVCDLCASTDARIVLLRKGRSMTSDCRIVQNDLVKLKCERCGLVRAGTSYSDGWLQAHYAADYRLAANAQQSETIFRSPTGPVPRSEAIAQWVISTWDAVRASPPRDVLEIGCGDGRVLERILRHWPATSGLGRDPNRQAVEIAKARGLNVEEGAYQQAQGEFDLVYAFAVMEHVPSPSDFMEKLASLLQPEGVLVLSQPTQEDVSHDIYFIDHLYHFRLPHISLLAAKAGLSEIFHEYPHNLLHNFSIHALSAGNSSPNINQWCADHPNVNIGADFISDSIDVWNKRFARMELWLHETNDLNLCVWGLGEFFRLLCAYTSIDEEKIYCGIDNNVERYEQAGFPFKIMPDLPTKLDRGRVLLSFVPGSAIRNRLDELDVPWICPLEL